MNNDRYLEATELEDCPELVPDLTDELDDFREILYPFSKPLNFNDLNWA